MLYGTYPRHECSLTANFLRKYPAVLFKYYVIELHDCEFDMTFALYVGTQSWFGSWRYTGATLVGRYPQSSHILGTQLLALV